jgi:hypothetical protein
LASLKPASEQFKKLSKYITIAANMNGELKIEVESAYAVCSAQFDNLSNPSLSMFNAMYKNQLDVLISNL